MRLGNGLSKVDLMPQRTAICRISAKSRRAGRPGEFIGDIPDEFVVGYGIDYAQRYRHLPYIGKVILLDE